MSRNTLDTVQLDLTGATLTEDQPKRRAWRLETGDTLALDLEMGRLFEPGVLESADFRLQTALEIASATEAGLVEVEFAEIDGHPALRMITKMKQGAGWTYMGWILVSFENAGYYITVTCPEFGMTGYREAIVFDQLLGTGEVSIEEDKVKGWFLEGMGGGDTAFRPNLSEDRSYDSDFPDHPLSRARSLLSKIEQATRIERGLEALQ